MWSYALAGFGYILPATFLSQMAAARFRSLFAQFVWPVFGIAAVAGIVAAIATRRFSRRRGGWQSLSGHRQRVFWRQKSCPDQWSGSQCFSGRRRPDGCGPAGIPVRTRTGTGARPLYGRIADHRYAVGQLGGPLVSSVSAYFTGKLEPALWVAFAALIIGGLLVFRDRSDIKESLSQ